MKKILTLLGAISIAGSGASTVVSCGENNTNNNNDQGGFNPWDFATWGEKQKTIFAKSYLDSVSKHLKNYPNSNEWRDWQNKAFTDDTYEDMAVNAAGKLVVGDAWPEQTPSYTVYDQNQNLIPDDSSTLIKDYLKNGINLYLDNGRENRKFIIINIQGDIT